jgi:hypothetical protein
VRDQEIKSRRREEGQRERMGRLEKMVLSQNEKLDKLEDLVYRVMHRDRVAVGKEEAKSVGSPGTTGTPDEHQMPSDQPSANQDSDFRNTSRPDQMQTYYSISSV